MKLTLKIAILCVALAASTGFSDQIAVSSFKYLNSNENPVIIGADEAQDLLNVNISPGGKSVLKRAGYGVYKTLPTSQGVHGGWHFFDTNGSEVQVWASSTSVYGIVSDGTPTQIVSSATLNSTLDCSDIAGSAYCVDSNRDFYIKTNGASLTSWQTSPLGTMIESTPDRIIVAGVSGSLNTLFVSQSNVFTNFTAGPLTTDAFTEVIAAPGAKITHIRSGCGKLLWWKDTSFGYFAFDDQYSAQIKIISDVIGTFDNTSAIDPGGSVWFRGQDGHIYQYDCSGLIRQTVEITPQIQASGRRTSNLWIQTSQGDWQTGASSATSTLSFTISPGDIVTSSFNVTENSSTSWNAGTASNVTVGVSSLSLTVNNLGNITNPDFESALTGNWYNNGDSVQWQAAASRTNSCTILPQTGSLFAAAGVPSGSYLFEIIDLSSNTLASIPLTGLGTCVYQQKTLASASDAGKRVRFRLRAAGTGCETLGCYLSTSDSYIFSGSISLYYAFSGSPPVTIGVDNIQLGSSTITSGTFTSQAFNTGMPYSFVYASATWTANTSTPSFVLQKSANGSTGWFDISTTTGTNLQTNQRYLRYLSTFTALGTDNGQSSITSVTLIARSSGTYFSAWKNAPSLSAWSTFNPTYTNGDGSNNFYIRTSTSPQSVLNSTVAWVAQPANSLVAAPVGTYFQVIDSFTITSATGTTPTLSAFTLNWFDGNSSDQAYMIYFDNAIWASIAYGVGVSSNTYIFRRDLINDGWGLYNFGAGGMLVQNNNLFFGDVALSGRVFQFGSGTADNGAAINAFWKSKNFAGADPFLLNQLIQIDTIAKQNTGQALTSTYALDTSTTTTAYTINLSSTSQAIINHRKQLPAGKNGYLFSLMYGDNTATSSWELMGFRIGFVPQTYRPSQ